MQLFSRSLAVALTWVVNLAISILLAHTASLGPRGQFRTNAPDVISGTPSEPDALIDATSNSHLTPRIDNGRRVTWHNGQFGSQTYIVIAPGTPLPEPQVMEVVNGARHQMLFLGTGVLPIDRGTGWMCHVVGEDGVVLDVRNADNHQLTRGVLLAALDALTDYMTVRNRWAEVTFQIFDGSNQVGVVSIGT